MRILLVTGRRATSSVDTVWKNFLFPTRKLVASARHSSSNGNDAERQPGGPGTKATEEQLISVKETMVETFPRFFVKTHEFGHYHQNVLFEDNIRNIRTNGIFNFYLQATQVRIFCLLRYAKTSVTVLKATHDTQDSKVCIRWTFRGNFVLKILNNWFSSKLSQTEIPPDRTLDGFSIMYVGGDGRVWKHVIEKMIPDSDSVLREDSSKTLISPDIRGSLAVEPKP